MLLVALAWMYAVVMVAVVEATGPQGSVLGALVTLALYGVLPLAILGYLFFGPARRRRQRAAQAAAAGSGGLDPDGGGHAAGDPVAPVREEP